MIIFHITKFNGDSLCKIINIKFFPILEINGRSSSDYLPEVVEAFELLLSDTLLLDSVDSKCNGNVMEIVLKDWLKHNFFNEIHIKHIIAQRENIKNGNDSNTPNSQSIINYIIRADVSLSTLLKALNGDIDKSQDALLGTLCQMLVGMYNLSDTFFFNTMFVF